MNQPWGSPLSGWLADRLGSTRVMIAGGGVAVAGLLLGGRLDATSAAWEVAVPLVVFGVATSLFMPPATRLIFNSVPPTALASAASMATSGRYVGQSLGAALGTALLVAQGEAGIAQAFGTAMNITAGVLLAGMAALFLARPLVAAAGRRSGTPEGP